MASNVRNELIVDSCNCLVRRQKAEPFSWQILFSDSCATVIDGDPRSQVRNNVGSAVATPPSQEGADLVDTVTDGNNGWFLATVGAHLAQATRRHQSIAQAGSSNS